MNRADIYVSPAEAAMCSSLRIMLAVLIALFLSSCTTPVSTKPEAQSHLISTTTKRLNYLDLARYWDLHAEKQTIDFKGASYLTIWEKEGVAEITIGNGPYYGLIELVKVDQSSTIVKTYAWGYFTKRMIEWRDLILSAPEG